MPPDEARLRATVEQLAAIERPSASEGERRAAEWIRDELRGLGLEARIEEERAHGTYWVPLGLLTAAAGAAGLAGNRRLALAAGALAAAGVADDVAAGPHAFRRLLRQRTASNVVAAAGDPAGARTLVFVAHHDAARGGLIFAPEPAMWVADTFPEWFEGQNTSPQVMRLVVAGPALVALGALLGSGRVRGLGTAMALTSALSFADIGLRRVVPGANDNLTGVAVLLELARALAERPVRGVRVLLVSTGAEESFMEGMRGFARRHFPALPRESTEFVCVDTVGSPELAMIEGEGMLVMRDYAPGLRERVAECAARTGVHLRRGLRLGFATDGLIALRAGYPSVALGSVTRYKFAANYHSQRDVPANVDYQTVRGAAAVCEELIREAADERTSA
jgi:Peptidase family M28